MLAASFMTHPTPAEQVHSLPSDETWLDWVNLVRAEYCEMPGLSLSAAQVQRLWNLQPALTQMLLTHLVETGFLRCTRKGTYVRPHCCPANR